MSRKAVSVEVLTILAHFEVCSFPSKSSKSLLSINRWRSLMGVCSICGKFTNYIPHMCGD